MTMTEPAGIRPVGSDDPATARVVDWSGLRERTGRMRQWTDVAVKLATDAPPVAPPSRWTLWRNRRRAAAIDRAQSRPTTGRVAVRPVPATDPATRPSKLRLIPPVAALGTAFVLQVVAMTDVVGGRLAEVAARSDVAEVAARPELGYLAAMLLGIAVASCAEGGAAYLMDLYDRHLMARDSVWVLRLAMVGYVAASAGVIHWWLDRRELPGVISWVLAGMSASALFLWSRGSRWRHRAAMRSAGQLDPAMPRMPMAAKIFHPVRWIVTLYLVSWEPAETPAEARARYEQWSAARRAGRMAGSGRADHPEPQADHAAAVPSEPVSPTPALPTVEPEPADPADPADDDDTGRPDPGSDHGPTALADAAFLRTTYGDNPPGRNELYRQHGGNKERWTNALRAHADQADQPTTDIGGRA